MTPLVTTADLEPRPAMATRVHGPWVVQTIRGAGGVYDAEGLHAVNTHTAVSLSVKGDLAHAINAGRPCASLELAASLSPALRELLDARSTHGSKPFTRGGFLRGSGFEILFIELTDQCNERCVHCYASASPEGRHALPWSWVQNCIRDAAALGFRTVQLTGGDPLLSGLVVPAARYAREVGVAQVEVYTNGLRLSGRLFDDLREADVSLAFSLYGHDPVIHDAVTQTPLSHERTLRAIGLAASAGMRLRVSVILTGAVSSDLEETYRLLEGRGISRSQVRVGSSRAVGRGELVPLRLGKAADEVVSHSLGAEREGVTGSDGSHHGASPQALFGGKAAVAADGTVMPCIFDRAAPLGHLATQTLAEILTDDSPIERDIRDMQHAHRHAQRLSCHECRIRASLLR